MKLFYIFTFLVVNAVTAQNSFFEYSKEGDLAAIQEILANNSFDINSTNKAGFSALMLAAYYNKTEVVELLLTHGAHIDQNSKFGTALMAACIKGHSKTVTLLIEQGADVNIKDAYGNSALIHAATYNNTEIARLLIQAGADPNVKDFRGNKPLDYAILKQNIELIKLLNTQ